MSAVAAPLAPLTTLPPANNATPSAKVPMPCIVPRLLTVPAAPAIRTASYPPWISPLLALMIVPPATSLMPLLVAPGALIVPKLLRVHAAALLP